MENLRYGMPMHDGPRWKRSGESHAGEFIANLVDPKGRKGYDARGDAA